MAYKCVAWQETRYGTGGDQPPVMVLTPTAPSLAASPSGSERGLRARIVHRAQKGGRPRDVPLACSGTPCKHGREHPGLPPLSRGGEQRGQEKTNASSWAGGTGEVRGGGGNTPPYPPCRSRTPPAIWLVAFSHVQHSSTPARAGQSRLLLLLWAPCIRPARITRVDMCAATGSTCTIRGPAPKGDPYEGRAGPSGRPGRLGP